MKVVNLVTCVIHAGFWAANHSDSDAQRSVCCPFDFILGENDWAYYGDAEEKKLLQYLCFPRFGMKVRLYAGHVVVFDSVEPNCATRPFALVEGAQRSSLVVVSQKKYFSHVPNNHFSGQSTRQLPDSNRVRGVVKKARLSH